MPPRRAPPFSSIRDPNTASASPLAQRADEIGQALGRVLPVAVDQRDEIEAALDGEVVADLLVAAVALVDRVEEDVQRKRQRPFALHHARLLEGAILRRVVEHQHFDVVLLAERVRHAGEDLADGLLRVVGDDEDEEPGLTQGKVPRRTVPPTRPQVKAPDRVLGSRF